ncbi:hypothetical protein [Sulfurovum sp.]|uniref:hypothetical protein n=1 Tax=Sulfurovum sp. TaxID=1969726 RepID=UPI00286839CB|nr:hypothetical protein [Sulfurovum sp.]
MKKILFISSLAITAIIASPIAGVAKHAVKHDSKSSIKNKNSIKDKSKKDVLNLDKKQNKMERKMKTKALKAVI